MEAKKQRHKDTRNNLTWLEGGPSHTADVPVRCTELLGNLAEKGSVASWGGRGTGEQATTGSAGSIRVKGLSRDLHPKLVAASVRLPKIERRNDGNMSEP